MQPASRDVGIAFPSTRPIALMRVAGLTPFIAHLVRTGSPVRDLLARAYLPTNLLYLDECVIPAAQAIAFMEDAAAVRGIEYLGLRAGTETPIQALGVFGRLVAGSETLGAALDAFVRLAPAFDSGSRWRLVRQGKRAWLCHELTAPNCASYRQADQYWLGVALNLLRGAAGRGWRPDEIRLQTSEGPGARPEDLMAGARVGFSQTETAIGFSTSLWRRPLPRLPSARPLDRSDLERWIAAAPAAEFLESIEQVIATLSSPDHPRIDTVARAIGTGARTLQRRLAEAGATYERMLARTRLRAAAHLLENTNATVLDIALEVGYSDHAHFTRAFRRWTGVPPREFRRSRATAREGPLGAILTAGGHLRSGYVAMSQGVQAAPPGGLAP